MKKKRWLCLVLLAAAIIMCIYGAFRGDVKDVLIKATKICLECIGLG